MNWCLLILVAAASLACAETPNGASPHFPLESASQVSTTISGGGLSSLPDNPVEGVRKSRSWEFGPFVNGGFGLGNRSDYGFLSLGFQGGKVLTPVLHAGILTGQFELGANVMPLWQAYTPPPSEATFTYPCPTGTCYFVGPQGGGTYTGVSVTPVIFRWNFLTKSRRFQPWFQGAGGVIYTTHKFPPTLLVPHGTPGGTSVFNFSPQGGAGFIGLSLLKDRLTWA